LGGNWKLAASIGTSPPLKEPFAQNLTSCGWMAVKEIKKKEIYKIFVFIFMYIEALICG
jgi:hypothetical protein